MVLRSVRQQLDHGSRCYAAEIGVLWGILAQEPVRVFVRAARPPAFQITEAEPKACVDPQLRVRRRLGCLIPGQGLRQAFRQSADGTGNRIPDGCRAR